MRRGTCFGATEEGFLNYTEISKKLGVSKAAATKRVQRTVDKIIKGDLIDMAKKREEYSGQKKQIGEIPKEGEGELLLAM